MPIFFEPRKKAKAVIVLFLILLVVMINNLADRKDYADLDRTISSIYQDRLMPAGFLFQINHHLYQKRILEQSNNLGDANTQALLDGHNRSIDKLIKRYEKTYLTLPEKKQWMDFKSQLDIYDKEELLAMHASTSLSGSKEKLHSSFDKAILSLNSLNEIQATEGNQLQRHSKSIIGGTIMHSYLEISLLFVVCIIILILSGFSEHHSDILKQKHLLN